MKITILLLLALAALPCSAQKLDVGFLYGSYFYVGGDTSYEEFELSANGKFSSWLHQRPDAYGSWWLEGDIIYVKEETLDMPIKINIIELSQDRAIFQFDDDLKPALFKRVAAE